MAQKAPGKHFRKGVTLVALLKTYPDDKAAEAWFVAKRWPHGIACPVCGDMDIIHQAKHPQMPYRCKGCRKYFSVKTGTVMQGSKLGLQVWLVATYLLTTNLKGTSSMKLHRDLGITQKSAWHLAHRIRETWGDLPGPFGGPVEFDETYMGGLEKNKHSDKKLRAGTGMVGKTAVAGARDRETGKVVAKPIKGVKKQHIHEFVKSAATDEATIYTDEAGGYKDLPHKREAVNHSIGEYVRDKIIHTNGIESLWAMLKRGHKGTYHKFSKKHLGRYVNEFVGRHNDRPSDTIAQMSSMVQAMEGRRLKYSDLTADNGLESGARGMPKKQTA